MTQSKSRRDVLLGAAALAGTAYLPRTASAQEKGRIVVGTWGGDYARLLHKNIEEPILIKDGWEVVQDQAGDPERRSKMLAEQRLPRGTSDVQGLSALNMFQMNDAGVVLPIDYGKLRNAGNLLPAMKYPYGVGQIYSGKVGVYNPKLITTAPVSYKDVFDPKHGNKLGIIDIQYQYTLVCAALAAELGIGVMWKARVVQWQNAGIPVKAVAPTEGTLAYVSGFVIPKNAPNKDGAYAYLDAMLEKSAQEAFAVDMGYNPTVANATVAPDLNTRIGFTPDEVKKLVDLDYDYMNKNDVDFKEWWDKVLKS